MSVDTYYIPCTTTALDFIAYVRQHVTTEVYELVAFAWELTVKRGGKRVTIHDIRRSFRVIEQDQEARYQALCEVVDGSCTIKL
jgi:hypothetical protein